jgi:2-dehydro-3-deoxyphosphogluconate aldolase / (4S)-4-hydroxy-2-oxoglutarate aldolase
MLSCLAKSAGAARRSLARTPAPWCHFPRQSLPKDIKDMTVNRMTVLSAMIDQGVIPVFFHPNAGVCNKVIQACVNGGARCIEFTNRGDFATHIFLDVARHFATADPRVIMGAGSIVDAPTAGLYIANGAKFVVGPLLNRDVAKVCNRRKIPYCPGCGTLSEIGYAEELGCEIVKIFPGNSVGGPDFVRSVLAPCPWTSIMPTGGVDATEKSLREWFEAGVVCVGMGTKLITQALLDAGDYVGIENKVRETVALIRTIRGR